MRIPLASYRLQFNPSFGFSDAAEIVPYLADLGVSDLYASPILRARAGSLHGYDVVDPNALNPELGAEADFERLTEAVRRQHMGWIQDVVPNHMAFDGANRMLMDLLENGAASPYRNYFDLDLDHPDESLRGRLLAPFLGRPYGEALENGEIALRYGAGGFAIEYFGLRLPLTIESYATILTHDLGRLRQRLGSQHPDFVKLLGVLYVLRSLPAADQLEERDGQIRFVKGMLWELTGASAEVRDFIESNLAAFNGAIPDSDGDRFQLLDRLLSEQLFRLSFWKVAAEEINYRRFFNINDLISLRVEDPAVYQETHRLILRLVADGKITALRIDHIDGLLDPTEYLERLRKNVGGIYIIVEKILGEGEDLPADWPLQGTTGYDFLTATNALFCDPRHAAAFDRVYAAHTRLDWPFDELMYEKKRMLAERYMIGDVNRLAALLRSVSSADRHGRDLTLHGLKRAVIELMACFPVYRSYIRPPIGRESDRGYILASLEQARNRNPVLAHELAFVERLLLPPPHVRWDEDGAALRRQFVLRFQQLTGPLMAKGYEDTLLYVYNRLVSLNEVGGNPARFGLAPDGWHAFNQHRLERWPYALNASSTHDTKRGEDTRARINVLSELPEEWETQLQRWSALNRPHKPTVRGRPVPDANGEYFLYQTLIGAFPFSGEPDADFRQRIKDYVLKSIREAKIHTGWLRPDHDYEQGCIAFIERILAPGAGDAFLESFRPFQRRVTHYGMLNGISQTLLKITAPGVPDFYQGTELWDFSLVDPDNRRPVDFGLRIRLLAQLRQRGARDLSALLPELMAAAADGRVKLFLIQRALAARAAHRGVFQHGQYRPLAVQGRFADHVVAFARHHEGRWAIVVAPRLMTALVSEGVWPLGPTVWRDTRITLPDGAPQQWRDALTDGTLGGAVLDAGAVLARFPVALLVNEDTA